MWLRQISILGLGFSLCAAIAQAKTQYLPPQNPPTPAQLELIRKSIAREKVAIEEIQKHAPLIQTYIQNMRPDPELDAVPESDSYMLSRIDFGKVFTADAYDSKSNRGEFFKGSFKAFEALGRLFQVGYSRDGFMEMMFIDPSGYDLDHYDFSFVRTEFLGSVRTMVFDARPKPGFGSGRFLGRIWIEDQDGNVVRFNGSYRRSPYKQDAHYWVHFDSWRGNLEPNVWLPMAIYAEEEDRPNSLKAQGFRAQSYFWGYSLSLPAHASDNETVSIDDVIDQSQSTQDLSPLQAQREWDAQAEHNVLDRLVTAGLLAPPSPFDKVMEQITSNIIIGNKLALPSDIHCRVLLTTPLEAASVGNTILLSKGLIDVLPSEADLAAVLSFELAQIKLGHQIDTRYAFDDRLLFPNEATFQRIRLGHSDQDDAASATEAINLLNNSVYKDKLGEVAVFLAELQAKEKELKALMTPELGDSVLSPAGAPWLSGISKVPALIEPNNPAQIAALPLGSHIRVDPWDDTVSYLNATPAPILTARDKMPLEVTPIYFRLHRYGTAQASTPSSPRPSTNASVDANAIADPDGVAQH
jgi:hypothetical protein